MNREPQPHDYWPDLPEPPFIVRFVVAAVIVGTLVICLFFTGCIDIHAQVRPHGPKEPDPLEPDVKPAPPAPRPKPDRWWNRPPQPKNGASIIEQAASETVAILMPQPPVSMMLTNTAVSDEAEKRAAVPSLAEQMQAVHNRIRADHNLSPQPLDASLCRAAQDYANYLASTNQQGHFAKGGPEQRARAAGFTGSLLTPGKPSGGGWTSYGIGEVLAFGHRDIESAFQGWLDSKGHREALCESTYNVCGFGYAMSRSGPVWVGMMGHGGANAIHD